RWWEPETEWHRTWKDEFPGEWQEKILYASTGEKYIADVHTSHGLVIEFQRSHIDPQERDSREHFYGNMVWVVDGTRLKKDYLRFFKAKDSFRPSPMRGFFFVPFPDECFPSTWLRTSAPVIFDFYCSKLSEPSDTLREALWCLLPGRAEGYA